MGTPSLSGRRKSAAAPTALGVSGGRPVSSSLTAALCGGSQAITRAPSSRITAGREHRKKLLRPVSVGYGVDVPRRNRRFLVRMTITSLDFLSR